MTRLLAAAFVLAAGLATASCTQQPGASGMGDKVAVVDGHDISRFTYDEYVKSVSGNPDVLTAEQRNVLLENLVRAQVLAAHAEATGVGKDPEAQAAMQLSRWDVLGRASQKKFLADARPTEDELRAEYATQVASMPKTEYRASHILVGSEAEATKVIGQLKAGGDFAQIARRVSTDAGTKDKGGDLDWFNPQGMTPAFAAAVTKLQKGGTSSPVQTEFGWHVIWLMDSRPATAPSFESVKDSLVTMVENRKFKAHVEALLARAKITRSL